MKPKILITDSLFIFDEHVKKLENSGFEVERLDLPKATEAELIDAIKGKTGYIFGGMESVTDKVIKATDKLKAIAFTGVDYVSFIPGHKLATGRGIAITNTPGSNTFAVAEYTLTLMLIMLRQILQLTSIGDKNFMTAQSITDVNIGIVGMGRIGERVTRMLKAMGATNIYYWNRTRKPELESELGIIYLDLEKLVTTCDVISNHVSSAAGVLITAEFIEKAKDDLLIINAGSHIAFDKDALLKKLTSSNARAAFDFDIEDERFDKLPITKFFRSNANTGFNTRTATQKTSDMAVTSLLNVLQTGKDQYLVNPEYEKS